MINKKHLSNRTFLASLCIQLFYGKRGHCSYCIHISQEAFPDEVVGDQFWRETPCNLLILMSNSRLIKSLKYSTVFLRPVIKSIFGFHPSFSLARVMSGHLLLGSSWGKGLKTILDSEPIRSIINLAKSKILISFGLPKFRGPVMPRGEFIILIIPSTVS